MPVSILLRYRLELALGDSSTSGAHETGAKVPSAPQALASSNSKVSAVNAADIAASAAAPAFSSNLHHELQQSREQLAAQQPQPPQASEPAVEQGDGSEFWS